MKAFQREENSPRAVFIIARELYALSLSFST